MSIPDGQAYHLIGAARDASRRLADADLTGLSDEAKASVTAEAARAIKALMRAIAKLDPSTPIDGRAVRGE